MADKAGPVNYCCSAIRLASGVREGSMERYKEMPIFLLLFLGCPIFY